MTDIPNIDDLPQLTPAEKQWLEETEMSWEHALCKVDVPCELWRIVSIKNTGGNPFRLSEWYASEDRVTAALERIKSEGYELVSVTKYRQVVE